MGDSEQRLTMLVEMASIRSQLSELQVHCRRLRPDLLRQYAAYLEAILEQIEQRLREHEQDVVERFTGHCCRSHSR